MRKLLTVCVTFLLILALAVPVCAAEGFIYCEPENLITPELNQQHLALGELSRETGLQVEMYIMTYTGEGIPMSELAEVLYQNKEEKPEAYLSLLIQVGQVGDGWTLHETYPWSLYTQGSISENKAFLNALHTVLDALITQDNWSGSLEEDRQVITLTAAALSESVLQLYSQPAAPETPYVIDDAGILTPQQRQELNAQAQKITETYGTGIYLMTVADFRDYGAESQIFDVLWNYYHDNSLGYGPDREGMILMLSMEERDFATFFYGENTEYAFNGYGQQTLNDYFLDNFGENDWFGGFRDYLSTADAFLAQAAAGEPVRDNPWHLAMLFVLIALFISFVVTRILWMQMSNVAAQKGAGQYQTEGGLVLTRQEDHFLNKTVTRRKIVKSSSGSGTSASHSGGGGSGTSGKF